MNTFLPTISIKVHPVFQKFGVSPTLNTAMLCNKLIKEGKQVYKLGFGESPFPVHPNVLKALVDNAHQKSYLNVQGLESLRSAIADYHNTQNQTSYTMDNIFISPGSKQTLLYTLDSIQNNFVVPTPCWVSHKNQADLLERHIQLIETNYQSQFKPSCDDLQNAFSNLECDNPMILLNYPNNPTGQTYSEQELQDIANINKNFLVLSDEIYGNVSFQKHTSISKFMPERTLTSSGISKWLGAGGWRFGYLIIPDSHDELKKAMNNYISESYSAVSAPIQYAALTAYKDYYTDPIQNYLEAQRRIFQALSTEICRLFNNVGIKVIESQGGFYLYPDFENFRKELADKGILNSDELTKVMLLETGVSVIPGSKFGQSADKLSFRLCYVDFDGELALNAAYDSEVDYDFLKKYCNKTLEGCQKVAEWAVNL